MYSGEQLATLRSRDKNEDRERVGATGASPSNNGSDNSWLYVLSATSTSSEDCSSAGEVATDAGSYGGGE